MKIPVQMNYGRWIMNCPKCGCHILAEEKGGTVCPICYPNIKAKALQPLSNGASRLIHDMALIAETRELARIKKEIYEPDFPVQRQEIEAILRCRSDVAHMNWTNDETVEDLRDQNIAHGDPLPETKKGRK